METTITKNRILIWVIVILAAINLSTLFSIIYHVRSSQGGNKELKQQTLEPDNEKFSGRYFRDKLGFTMEQMDSFRNFNRNFRQRACSLTEDLSKLRVEMLEEMDKEKVDTSRLNNLSEQIGLKHTELKIITYKYYIAIKSICTSEQKIILKELFNEMFKGDLKMSFPGRGGQQGMGMGRGKGKLMKRDGQ
jgi:hypothetical protein